jgi:hypothetical protein
MKANRKLALSLIAVTAAIPLIGIEAYDRGSHDLYDRFHNYDYPPYNYGGYEYPYYQQEGYYVFPDNHSHLQPNYLPRPERG